MPLPKLRLRPPGRENPQRTVLSNAPIPKKAAPHVPPSVNAQIVHWAHWGLATLRGKLGYSENADRSQLFNCKPGVVPPGTHADCSQFCATCGHWSGVKILTDQDWTGTLWDKGKVVLKPVPGCFVIFGGKPGVHAGICSEPAPNGDYWVIAFGHAGGPDRVLLSILKAYFAKQGHPGVRFLVFG